MNPTRATLRLAALGAALLLPACDDDGPTPNETVAEVRVTPGTRVLEVGDTFRFAATARDADGDRLGVPVEWTSSAPTVAGVDEEGLVTALVPGHAEIMAGFGTVHGLATVEVLPRPSLTLEPEAATTAVGGTVRLTPTVRDAEGATIVWKSRNTGIATVEPIEDEGSPAALVTTVGPGETYIVASLAGAPDVADSTRITGTCSMLLGITPQNPTVVAEEQVQFTASAPVTWTSSAPSVATIDPASGLATGQTAGSTIITATTTGSVCVRAGAQTSTTLTVTPKRYGIAIAGFERPDGTGQGPTGLSGEVVVVVNRDAPANAGVAELVLLLDGAIVAREAYTSGAGQSRPRFDSRAYANGSHQIGAQLLKADGSVIAVASDIPVTIAN